MPIWRSTSSDKEWFRWFLDFNKNIFQIVFMEIAMNSRILNKEEHPSSIKMMVRRMTMAIVVMKVLSKIQYLNTIFTDTYPDCR